jgi:hypothetical protein
MHRTRCSANGIALARLRQALVPASDLDRHTRAPRGAARTPGVTGIQDCGKLDIHWPPARPPRVAALMMEATLVIDGTECGFQGKLSEAYDGVLCQQWRGAWDGVGSKGVLKLQ